MSNYLKELINTAESTCIEISATDKQGREAMSNYLKELINTAESTCIEISATDQGLSVTVRKDHGTMSEPLTKSASFWIDKNEKDMVGRLKHFLNIVRKP